MHIIFSHAHSLSTSLKHVETENCQPFLYSQGCDRIPSLDAGHPRRRASFPPVGAVGAQLGLRTGLWAGCFRHRRVETEELRGDDRQGQLGAGVRCLKSAILQSNL